MLKLTIILGAIATSALCACGGKSAPDYIRSAEQQIAQGNRRGAEVELLNAVKLAPDNGAALRLRGQNRLALQLLAAAEADLRSSLRLNEPAHKVLPALAQALVAQHKSEQLLTEYAAHPPLAEPQAEADFRALLGDAHLSNRDPAQARKAYQAALAAAPAHVQARLGLARAAGAVGDLQAAIAAVDTVIADAPPSAEAHFVRAMLLNLRGDRDGTQRSLERALAVSGDHVKSRSELASLLIDNKQYDQAAALLDDKSLAAAGSDGRLNYLRAVLDARRGALADARKRVASILSTQPDNAAANALAGEIELRSTNLTQAEVHLRRALASDRAHRGARMLLASLYLRQASPARAMEVLQPLLASGAPLERNLVLLAAEAHLLNGDLRRAAELYEAANTGGGASGPALMRLGQIALTRGDFDAGINALQEAAAVDPSFVRADAELVALHLYRNEPQKAVRAAEAFKAKAPQDGLAHALSGRARMAAGDRAGARREYDAALALEADAPGALSGLAELDVAEGKSADAVRRYESRLAKRADEQLFLALADLQRRTSERKDDPVDALRKGCATLPRSAALHAALARLYLERRDRSSALAVARQFAEVNAAEPAALELLAEVLFAAGQADESAATLEKLVASDPQAPRPLQRLAALQMQRRNPADAVATLKRAQRLAPNDLAVLTDLTVAQIASGTLDRAAESARGVQGRAPNRALGFVLLGDVRAVERNSVEAERAYRGALQLEPRHTTAAIKLCHVLSQTKRHAECGDLAARWLSTNPGDVAMRMFVGDRAAADRRFGDAVSQYEAVVARDPTHVAALNNLAWALGEMRNAQALLFAQRAARLAPYNADVLNTLGVIELSLGQHAKGIEHLATARSLAPDRLDLRLHHAKGLLKADRLDEARSELLTLAAESTDFVGKQEVAVLLKKLPARP